MLCNHICQLPEPGCWFSSTTGDTGVKVTLLSVLVKPLTGSLKTAVKLIGELLVGSAWPAAWLIVTEGGVVSAGVKLTLLSVLVEAMLRLPAASLATPAGMLASTVPALLMPLTATL